MIFLAALLKRARLSGVVDQKLLDVVDQHISYCRTYKQVVPDFGMIHQLAMDLSQMRWIIVDSGPFDSELKVKLNISEEDILGIFKETGSDKEKKTGSDKFFAKLFASFDAPRD